MRTTAKQLIPTGSLVKNPSTIKPTHKVEALTQSAPKVDSIGEGNTAGDNDDGPAPHSADNLDRPLLASGAAEGAAEDEEDFSLEMEGLGDWWADEGQGEDEDEEEDEVEEIVSAPSDVDSGTDQPHAHQAGEPVLDRDDDDGGHFSWGEDGSSEQGEGEAAHGGFAFEDDPFWDEA